MWDKLPARALGEEPGTGRNESREESRAQRRIEVLVPVDAQKSFLSTALLSGASRYHTKTWE